MRKVIFSANYEIVIDQRGIYHVASGCAPHHPDDTRYVIRNAETNGRIPARLSDAASDLAVTGDESALLAFIKANFRLPADDSRVYIV